MSILIYMIETAMNNDKNFINNETVVVGFDESDSMTVMLNSESNTFASDDKKNFNINKNTYDGLMGVTVPAIMLISRICNSKDQFNPENLRVAADAEMRRLHADIIRIGLKSTEARIAHYFICATIDDVVLNSPWGNRSSWTRNNMVSTFHVDAEGGDRVLELAENMRKNPAKYRELLELAYLCLSLGFEGRFRVTANGQTELKNFRDSLYAAAAQLRGPAAADLSPHWRGSEIPLAAQRRAAPLWVAATGVAAILLGLFIGLGVALDNRSGAAGLMALNPIKAPGLIFPEPPPPPVQIAMASPVIPPAPPPVPVPESPPRPSPQENLGKFLAREIADNLVEVREIGNRVIVRLLAKGLFAPGSAALETAFRSMLENVGKAMEKEPGRIIVTGHTDNTPIPANKRLKYRSNLELSQARADEVRALLSKHISDAGRLTAEGRADSDPIGDNDTPQGRAANRRIDLILIKPGH